MGSFSFDQLQNTMPLSNPNLDFVLISDKFIKINVCMASDTETYASKLPKFA